MSIITEDHVIRFLEDAAHAFHALRQPVVRSFPDISKSSWASALLVKIVEGGNVQFNIHDNDIKRCYQNGWIHRVALDGCDDVAVLPSRLHEK